MAKTVGSFNFLKTVISRDFFPEHKNREKRGNFTKSVIYRDQKSKKLPNDRHNEHAVVRILIENGAEISDNNALALHCMGVFWMAVLRVRAFFIRLFGFATFNLVSHVGLP